MYQLYSVNFQILFEKGPVENISTLPFNRPMKMRDWEVAWHVTTEQRDTVLYLWLINVTTTQWCIISNPCVMTCLGCYCSYSLFYLKNYLFFNFRVFLLGQKLSFSGVDPRPFWRILTLRSSDHTELLVPGMRPIKWCAIFNPFHLPLQMLLQDKLSSVVGIELMWCFSRKCIILSITSCFFYWYVTWSALQWCGFQW